MAHTVPILTESEIRKAIQQQRLAMSAHEIQSKSFRVIQNFQRCWGEDVSGLHGRCIGVYRSFSFEVEMSTLAQWCLLHGSKLFYPKTSDSKEKKMMFTEDESPLLRGTEPTSQSPIEFNIHNNNLDIIFVPGVVFGERGERIGMGQGYYDRYLAADKHAIRIALAFDFQVQPTLPQKSTDQTMHWLITENREFKMPELSRRLSGLQTSG